MPLSGAIAVQHALVTTLENFHRKVLNFCVCHTLPLASKSESYVTGRYLAKFKIGYYKTEAAYKSSLQILTLPEFEIRCDYHAFKL